MFHNFMSVIVGVKPFIEFSASQECGLSRITIIPSVALTLFYKVDDIINFHGLAAPRMNPYNRSQTKMMSIQSHSANATSSCSADATFE